MKKLIPFILWTFCMTAAASPLDFSHITSKQQMIAEYQKGNLEPIYLFPIELGGEASERNTVYVPFGVKDIKTKLDGTLIKFAHEGTINKLSIKPIYKGDSFIPSKIAINASNSHTEGNFDTEIDIW